MKASELMSRDLYYVTPATRIGDVVSAMNEYGLTCLPVMSRRRLAGIVTARDLALRGYVAGIGRQTPVRRVMTTDVVCCRCEDDVPQICHIMTEHRRRRLPVLDRRGAPVGFLALSDLAPVLSMPVLYALQRALDEEPTYIATADSRTCDGSWPRRVAMILFDLQRTTRDGQA